ncbi:MAG: DUF126 domain-containing protein [Acidilobaceae archaeon]
MICKEFKGRAVVSGRVEGEALLVDSISFYGDVDPHTATLFDGRSVTNKVIIAGRPRGSTVGPYVLYSLKQKGLEPKAILLASKSDPVLVAGAVLADVVLIDNLPREVLEVKEGSQIFIDENGVVKACL